MDRSLTHARELLTEDCDALDALAEVHYDRALLGKRLSLDFLRPLPRALIRRIFHRFFSDRGHLLNRNQMETLLGAAVAGKKFRLSIGTGKFCTLDGSTLSCD
jgi:hypothetical protein